MKYRYNNISKKFSLELSLMDLCSTCGNYSSCPLIEELEDYDNANVLIKRSHFYKEECDFYFYLPDKKMSKLLPGMYLGDLKNLGFDSLD